MERMMDLEEMLRELSEKYINSKSVEVYEEDLEGWFKIIDDLREENKKLKEKVETLELWLDNKEKLNEEYRKEIDKYKRQYEHSMGFMEEDTLQELRDIGKL